MPKPGGSPSIKWTGTKGDDVVNLTSLNALKQTTYDGAAGYDTLNLSGITSGGVTISVNMNNPGTSRLWADSPFHGSWWTYIFGPFPGTVAENTIKNFEKIVGTNFNDYIEFNGGTVARVIDGGDGDDAIRMGSSTGTSTMIGGLGSDQLFGSRNSNVLVGGTYIGGSTIQDDTPDTFTMFSGTILDFRVGVDTLYIDGAPTSAIWEDVIGVGARLTMAPDRVVTLVGVDAETMNEIPIGYVLGPGWGVSGAGDDFIAANQSPSADHFIFPAGSGHDELVGFEVENDTLTFAGTPSFSEVDYHGDTALLATYDDGNSSVLLIGLDISDAAQVHFELI